MVESDDDPYIMREAITGKKMPDWINRKNLSSWEMEECIMNWKGQV